MFCITDYRAGDPLKYRGLDMSPAARDLLNSDPRRFASYCNGVGSKVGFWNKILYHLIPNCIGLINITPASDIHDVEYTVPTVFATMGEARKAWKDANLRFLSNCRRLIERGTSRRWLRALRYKIATEYYRLLGSESAWGSFLAGRTINNCRE